MEKAADFTLKDDRGQNHSLADYAGKWLVLYFYPKDDTPGCTTQACSLRDERDELAALGAEIVGVSMDEPSDHEKFKSKYSLNFTLLSDPDGQVTRLYEAWGQKQFGREGVLRKTYIISPEGLIAKVFKRAIPEGHGGKVKQALVDAQSA